MKFPTYNYEAQKQAQGFLLVAGCDEAGIGPLAGPVVAASVVLDPQLAKERRSKTKWWYRVRDSKTVNEKERGELEKFILDNCLDFGIGIVSYETIDKINIHNAAMLVMQKSVRQLKLLPQFLFLDGIHKIKKINVPQEPVVSADSKILSVACASILAKTARDRILCEYHKLYPQYNFVKHKGYPTKAHKQALIKFGVSPVHRKSFTFVKECLNAKAR